MSEKVKNVLLFVAFIVEYVAYLLLGHCLVNFILNDATTICSRVIAGIFLAMVVYVIKTIIKGMTICIEEIQK